ncbi:MAG: aminotransferase class I/II-fold pyridoxal phosphate-dependent enzyme [Candidatus Omnitrophota bacterium]|nr:aminotransferase class I/II-fold pyridoxal phosphate-dependent enzyme [Candidatus Omnitrophota bacterium]
MDGDRPPLREIADLKKKHACMLMVDEAHATGIFGENGSGVVEEEGLADDIELIMGTFGKALGSFGAYIACSMQLKEYLINSSRSFIYSTALPASVAAANLASISLIEEEPARRKKLLENSRYFREALKAQGLEIRGASQIVPLILGDAQKAVSVSEELKKRGYWALPIRPPTVPRGESRIRFSLTYHHTREILEKLIDDIRQALLF